MSSVEWARLADLISLIGVALCMGAAVVHLRAKRAGGGTGHNAFSRAALGALWTATVLMGVAVGQRWVEVNHFPSQTMSEVVTMFSFALLVSMVALKPALGLMRRGSGWPILDDALLGLVMLLSGGVRWYVTGLSTAERDLPPALQSYWFAPHLSALIFSYATLGIAALICALYFSMRFWNGVFVGGRSKGSQLLVLLIFVLVPFLQVVALPILVVTGLVYWRLHRAGEGPTAAGMLALEKEFDEVSFRAFSVGIPFLTAGLFMGAFWAQEAWANYWGWDSKENSALITWMIYVIYLHVRMLGGYRGEKAMAWLLGGALAIFTTFQLFGYLPDSQKSLHRYTDDQVVPKEGMQGPAPSESTQ
jgi:cytochrome c-type biogenesis protein CcsB